MQTEIAISNVEFLRCAAKTLANLFKAYINTHRPPDKSGGVPFFGNGIRILGILDSVGSKQWIDIEASVEFGEAEEQFEELCEYRKLSLATDLPLPLALIEERFGLEEIDVRLLLMTLSPRLLTGFDEVLGYLNNDMTIRGVTPILAAGIVSGGNSTPYAASRLTSGAPLLKYRLIELNQGGLEVPDGIFEYVVEPGGTNVGGPDCRDFPFKGTDEKLAEKAADIYRNNHEVLHFVVAKDRIRADAFIAEVSRFCGFDGPAIFNQGEDLKITLRDSIFSRNSLLIKDPTDEGYRSLRSTATEFPGKSLPPIFVVFENTETFKYNTRSRYEFPFPDYQRRLYYWRYFADSVGTEISGDVHSLAYDYKLGGDEIATIVKDSAGQGFGTAAAIEADDLREKCKDYSSRSIGQYVQMGRTNYDMDDIVLPDKPIEQLNNILNCVRNRRKVIEEWGFAEKRSYGLGISALFSGPPGTGKTMAAGIIANNLKLPLFKIDLASVVSKYIGETEKNLKEVFNTAHKSNAVLFFDEADALFGKRTEVKDAHDRYANIEVSFLLQQMEEYSGLAVLATNKEDDLDHAFKRRIQFVVKFPFPNKDIRKKIWEKAFPSGIPVSPDLDYGTIAAKYPLAGGNISNAVLLASYFAAEKSTGVGEKEIIAAIKQQYDNLGEVYPGDI